MRLLVAFADARARDAALERVRGVARGAIAALGVERVELPARSAAEAAARIAVLPGVRFAEPDHRVRLTFSPNDSYFLSDPITGLGQWGIRKAEVDKAWDVQRGAQSLTVAIVDSGVDNAHPDLVGALAPAARFVTVPDPSCPAGTTNRDDNGHGTHVAGIVGAIGNNGQGIAGVAFGVKVMPIKALDCTGAGFLSDVANAITYAADNGARVVNVSLGSPNDSQTLRSAVSYALGKNVAVVAAAGNCGSTSGTGNCPTLNATSYPAAIPGVIAVGATETDDQPASFSTAASYVSLAAPGVRMISTFPTYKVQLNDEGVRDSTYTSISGTSQAAPFVAGVIALLLSRDATLTPAAVLERLQKNADDVGPKGTDTKSGAGRVNARRALVTGTIASVTVSPAAVTLQPSASQQFTAQTKDASGNVVSAPVAWSATGGTVTTFGLYTAGTTAGQFAVTASADGASGSATVTIAPAQPTSIAIAPATATLVPNATQQFKAEARDQFGNVVTTAPVAWSATGGTISGTGLYLAGRELGTFQVSARTGTLTATASVSVIAARYGATYAPQSVRTLLASGTATSLRVALTNTSNFTWAAGGPAPVFLSSHWFDAAGRVVTWDGPRAPFSADVTPGSSAVVDLPLRVPSARGQYTLRVDLVHEGVTWFSAEGVAAPSFAVTVNSGFDAKYEPQSTPLSLQTGTAGGTLSVVLTNTGVKPWPAAGTNPVRLSYHWRDASGRVVAWDGQRGMLPRDTAPGTTATVSLPVMPPSVPGSYFLELDLVQEGLMWFSDDGVATQRLGLAVASGYGARYTIPAPPALLPGTRLRLTAALTNTGAVAWTAGGATPFRLAYHVVDASGNVLVWDGTRGALAADVAAGAAGDATLVLDAPATPGTYTVRVDLVREGVTWFSGQGAAPLALNLIVDDDRRATLSFAATSVSRSAPQPIAVTVLNASAAAFVSEGANPVMLASHWLAADGSVLLWDGPRAALPRLALLPGEQVQVLLPLAPAPAGAASLAVDLVQEGLAWFGATFARPVTLAP